jgi:hypothetical protein
LHRLDQPPFPCSFTLTRDSPGVKCRQPARQLLPHVAFLLSGPLRICLDSDLLEQCGGYGRMATAPVQNTRKLQKNSAVDRYFFTFVATSMIGISLVGFVPSIANPAERRAPVSACRSSRRRVPRVACTLPGPEQASSKWRVVMHRRWESPASSFPCRCSPRAIGRQSFLASRCAPSNSVTSNSPIPTGMGADSHSHQGSPV